MLIIKIINIATRMLRYSNKGGREGRLKHSQTLHLVPVTPRKTSKKTKIDDDERVKVIRTSSLMERSCL